MVILLILLAIPAVFLVWAVGGDNGLVDPRNACRNAFAQIDMPSLRWFAFLPDRVETAKGCLEHGRETLDAVVAPRAAAQAGLKVPF